MSAYDSGGTTFSNVTGNDVVIGKHEGTNEAFLGRTKYVRGWSQALTDAQIEAVYETDTGTGSGSFPTPDFYYPFAVDADEYGGNPFGYGVCFIKI